MEQANQKSLERVISEKALKIGRSFPCQICVFGFLCGVCLASVFVALFTSLGSFQIGGLLFSSETALCNSSSPAITPRAKSDLKIRFRGAEGLAEPNMAEADDQKDRVKLLLSAWEEQLTVPASNDSVFLQKFGLKISNIPVAPHFENCDSSFRVNKRLDNRLDSETFPRWMSWKGLLDSHPEAKVNEELRNYWSKASSEGAYPPWITGSDEDNYPLTRKVQRDLWLHQHPMDCNGPNIKFLVADWETLPGFGIGAQIAGMCGLLRIAVKEKRVLVTNFYNRADHDGCKGTSRSSWSCYFFPETSQECRIRAFELMRTQEPWEKGIITVKDNYTSKEIWAGQIPRKWGEPWNYMQPTTEINGSLIVFHRKMDRRWWRAQAVRYLMRFPSRYTCGLMNRARHTAFGKEAAQMVLASSGENWPKKAVMKTSSEIEEYVWSNHKPWVPRPLLSMHVRMGDKACEMKLVSFEEYVRLAGRIRHRFPNLKRVWLSTEMQEVIDKSKQHSSWEFYYTDVKRQAGNGSMAKYEASLGRETSTNYPLVNFLMAVESNFFIGALGSTWCYLIDGMRNTGGKVMSGYLSVNKDRFW